MHKMSKESGGRQVANSCLITLLSVVGIAAHSLIAAQERIADFGAADTSAGNTFWNVSGYNGGTVWRSASTAAVGFDSRSLTHAASRGIPLCTEKAGLFIIFH